MRKHTEDSFADRSRPAKAVMKMRLAHEDAEWKTVVHAAKEALKTANGDLGQIYTAYEELYEAYAKLGEWAELKRFATKGLKFSQNEKHPSIFGTSIAFYNLTKALTNLGNAWPELEEISYAREAFGRENENVAERFHAYESLALALEKQEKWPTLAEVAREQIAFAKECENLNVETSGHCHLITALRKQHSRSYADLVVAQEELKKFIEANPEVRKLHPQLEACLTTRRAMAGGSPQTQTAAASR